MSNLKILIVEDEQVVARDLQLRLIRLGYDVPAIAASGAEALLLLTSVQPELILTDIRLGSEPDGIDLAARIRLEHELPVIYITAFTDDETLKRAKVTEPYGYVVKPFNTRELQIAIEIAVYKHRVERELKENRNWLAAILQSIRDAVIATDSAGLIVFMNPAAEVLTGWRQNEAHGLNLPDVFSVVTHKNFLSPWLQVSDRVDLPSGYLDNKVLIAKNGKENIIQSTVSLLKNEIGREIGEVVVFRASLAQVASVMPVIK